MHVKPKRGREVCLRIQCYSLERQRGDQAIFCVLYKFTVKSGHEAAFRRHWLNVTQHLYRYAGSLGSRLHKANTGEYIGYAQWPSRHVWEQQREKSDTASQAHRQAMRACCASIEVLYELDATDDWLQREVYG